MKYCFIAILLSLSSCKGVDQVGNAFGVVAGGGSGSSGGGFEVTLLTLNPTAYDFGAITLNATSTKEVVVTNSGQTAIEIGSIAIVGSSSFTQTNTCGSSLGVSSSCAITVAFTPTSSTAVNAILSIDYNDGAQKAMSVIGRGGSNLVFNGIDTVTNVGARSARINWSGATGGSVTSYQVQRLVAGSWVVISGALPNTARHFVDNSLSPATTYSWRAYAIDAFGVADGNVVVKSAATSVIDFDAVDPDDLEVVEGATTTTTLSCSDTIGSTPVYSLVSQSDSDAGCSVSGSTLSCTPVYKTHHVNWTSDITLRCVIDGETIDNVETLSVLDSTRPPVLTVPADRAFPNHLPVGTALSLTSSATDPDGDTLTFSCTVRSTNISSADPNYMAPGSNCNLLPAIQGTRATFNSTTGVLSWTPSTTQFGTYEFGITVSDGYGGTDSDSFSITVAAPQFRYTLPSVSLDALFADGSGTGLTSQPTTWTDLSGNGFHGTILGTGDNGSGHWKGNGTHTDPYRLSLDGANDYVRLSGTSMPGTYLSHVIRFRIPSSAPDGAHPIVSLMNKGVIAVIKGAGSNQIQATSYASGDTWTMAGTVEYDKWYALYFTVSSLNGDGNIIIREGNNFGPSGFLDSGWSTALTINNQSGVGVNEYYIGYKPAALGPVGGVFAQGTAVYGNVEIATLKILTALNDNDAIMDSYFFHERLKRYPLGDTRLPSMTLALDAESNSRFGYIPMDTATDCTTGYHFGSLTGKIVTWGYFIVLPRLLSYNGPANPGCLNDDAGFLGSGSAASPYRWVTSGVFPSYTYQTYIDSSSLFDPTTFSNSFDLWIKVGDLHNGDTGSPAGFGPAIMNFVNQIHFRLRALNLGDGTSKLQLTSSHPSGMNLAISDMGVTVDNSEWLHLAFTVSAGGLFRIYVNGVERYASADGAMTNHPFCSGHSTNGICGTGQFGSGHDWKWTQAEYALLRTYAGHTLSASEVLYNCNHDKARFQGATCGP